MLVNRLVETAHDRTPEGRDRSSMGRELWRCIEQHVHRSPGLQRTVLPADIARATGLSAQLVSNLQNKQSLPRPKTLAAVRDGLGIPYRTLLDAALTDRGWLPEPPAGGGRQVSPEVDAALRGHVERGPDESPAADGAAKSAS